MNNQEEIKNSDNELHYIMTKQTLEKYDMVKTLEKVENLISDYKTAKFEYLVSSSILERISINYQQRPEQQTHHVTDKIGDNVSQKVDSQRVIDNYENVFTPLMQLLSPEEKKYYSMSMINNCSDQNVADSLCISRTKLIPIKQSCILKIALAFHLAVLKK